VGGAPVGKSINIQPAAWIGRNVSYVGSCQGSSVPGTVRSTSTWVMWIGQTADNGQFLPALVEFWRQGRLPLERIVTKYPYTEINQAIEDMHHGKCIKPVLIWE